MQQMILLSTVQAVCQLSAYASNKLQ